MIPYNVPVNARRMTIGVQGEDNVREFLFDVTEWRQLTGDVGTAEMVVQRRGDSSPYAAAITMHDENTVSWVPTAADTAKAGAGKIQLMWIASGQTVKTKIFDMKVDPALDYQLPDDSLDPWASWVPDVINADANYKNLSNRITTVETNQTSPFNFKGAVADMTELEATENPERNDTYFVEGLQCRYTWTGSDWQKSSLDESNYEDLLAALDAKGLLFRGSLINNNVTDVDTLTSPGIYLRTGTTAVSNWPNDETGVMIVAGPHSYVSFSTQIVVTMTSHIFIRYRQSSGWKAWYELAKQSSLETLEGNGIVFRGGVGSQDINDLYGPGIWQRSASANPVNWPNNKTGVLLAAGSPNSGNLGFQIVVTTPKLVFVRYKQATGNKWSGWIELRMNNMLEQRGTTYLGKTSYAKFMHNSARTVNEFLSVARSYYNHRKDVDEETGELCLRYGSTADGKISCSSYAREVMHGISYENSIYRPEVASVSESYTASDPDETEPDTDVLPEDDTEVIHGIGDYGWAVYPEYSNLPLKQTGVPTAINSGQSVTAASMLAHWMYLQGLRIIPSADWSNVEPGDLIFYAHWVKTSASSWEDPEVPEYRYYRNDDRFFNINHIALVDQKIPASDVETQEDLVNFEGFTASYPYPYIHTTLEVVREVPGSEEEARRYCVQRRWMEWQWEYKQLEHDAETYDEDTVYTAGDICNYKGVIYRFDGASTVASSTGPWDGVGWTDLTSKMRLNNDLNTLVFVARPDLGGMTLDLEARVAALEAAIGG